MKNIIILFSLFLLCSCGQEEFSSENTDTKDITFVDDGVVYPASIFQKTRANYGDSLDWVNSDKVTLPNGEEVDLPWVDGGSLPFFMQQKLSPNNGWELVAHTMRPDTQNNRAYLVFHNYITGVLRVFCYMTTYAVNNNGYWKISFSQPTSLLNFTGKYALPMDENGPSEIVVSNSTTQDGKGFALGWNGFELELAYDPDATGIMQIMPMNVTATNIELNGALEAKTEGTIISNEMSSTPASNIVKGIGKLAGESAEQWLKAKLPSIQIGNSINLTSSLLGLAKSGVTSIFTGFSGLFEKNTQKILNVNMTTHGDIKMTGAATTPTAAPIIPVNLHLDMMGCKLGGWNLAESPEMIWWSTAFDQFEENVNVTNREYIYQVPQPEYISFDVVSNPKASVDRYYMNKYYVRSSELPDYVAANNFEYGPGVITLDEPDIEYNGNVVQLQAFMRVHARFPTIATSADLPFVIDFKDPSIKSSIVEYMDRDYNIDFYLQFVYKGTKVINGVENEYVSSRTVQCKRHTWGSEY